ncbi:DUF3795 domain-containing protein [Clostridium transplantifaecale]|uniref:DUF3795 domain-containing protein n=1 Tax=Clostridium transplantifaecale TaxID=2479838 RepID=UPI000F631AED|nr:DUF3795 domain-containing protein [Clostridium transplantifaecale]
MKDFIREDRLFSLCGLNCGLCTMHIGGYCPGCGGGEGNQSCRIAKCSLKRNSENNNREKGRPDREKIDYCHQCPEFPCEKYETIDEFDSFITHRNRRSDLEKHRNIGKEAYQEEQKRKTEILGELLANYNDGRRKNFFCLAVNLLECDELQAVLDQVKAGSDQTGQTIKERAACVVKLLQSAADERGIVLKLKKKRKTEK